MRKINASLVFTTLWLCAACATNQVPSPKFEIKGVMLGMTTEDAVSGRDDLEIDSVTGWVVGRPNYTLATLEIGDAFIAYEHGGRITSINATFPTENFGVIRSAFTSKYPSISCERVAAREIVYEVEMVTKCSATTTRIVDELLITDTLTLTEFLPDVSSVKRRKVGRVEITSDEDTVRHEFILRQEKANEPKPVDDI